MRLVSFQGGFGQVIGDDLLPMGPDLVAYLSGAAAIPGKPRPLAGIALMAPVPRPGKVICIGLNYRDHVAEMGLPMPQQPVIFAKWCNSVVGPDATVRIPTASSQIDFEVELGVIIGQQIRCVDKVDALNAVGGYTVVNDLSARDLQFSGSQWTYGKAIDGFLPMGPVLVTADEIPDPQALALGCMVNGVQRQRSSTAEMVFGVADLISYLSQVMTLEPGDVIATGTPPGVAMGDKEPKWLQPGDSVTVWVEGIGELTTHLIAEPG